MSGKRRRRLVRDRIASALRKGRERPARRGGTAVPQNDRVLVDKVESEAIGHSGVPSGRVNVDAERGVVVLRGQVDSPDDVVRLEKLVLEVDGVRDVENLLHTPGTPPPNRP